MTVTPLVCSLVPVSINLPLGYCKDFWLPNRMRVYSQEYVDALNEMLSNEPSPAEIAANRQAVTNAPLASETRRKWGIRHKWLKAKQT